LIFGSLAKQDLVLVRGDSAYAREDIMKFCEAEVGVDYAFAMATNSQLKLRAHDVIQKAQADYEQRLAPVTALMETLFAPDDKPEAVSQLVPDATWYRSLCYKTQGECCKSVDRVLDWHPKFITINK